MNRFFIWHSRYPFWNQVDTLVNTDYSQILERLTPRSEPLPETKLRLGMYNKMPRGLKRR